MNLLMDLNVTDWPGQGAPKPMSDCPGQVEI